MFYIVGLGNKGEEYAGNRHNAGRMAVDLFMKKYDGKKAKVLVPDTFMNNTGPAVAKAMAGKKFVTKKQAEKLIVVYDDIDLALGTIKISYNKSSGGHNGLESIIKAVKTQEFTRIRIGVSPSTPKGKVKKPKGEEAVLKFLLGDFKTSELDVLKKVWKQTTEAIETIISEGRGIAMNRFN